MGSSSQCHTSLQDKGNANRLPGGLICAANRTQQEIDRNILVVLIPVAIGRPAPSPSPRSASALIQQTTRRHYRDEHERPTMASEPRLELLADFVYTRKTSTVSSATHRAPSSLRLHIEPFRISQTVSMSRPPGPHLNDVSPGWSTLHFSPPFFTSRGLDTPALQGQSSLTDTNSAGPMYSAYTDHRWNAVPTHEPIANIREPMFLSLPLSRTSEESYDHHISVPPATPGGDRPVLFAGCAASPQSVGSDAALILPQQPYKGHGASARDSVSLPTVPINVSAHGALQPGILAHALGQQALSPAFEGSITEARKGKKFTIRFHFRGRDEWVNAYPQQMNEYAAGCQGSEAVKAAWDLHGRPLKTSVAVPLMRAALVEKVAFELHIFMEGLKSKGIPLLLHGREVEFDHIYIIELSRPTDATVQPKLGILPEYRNLYLNNAGVAA